MTQYWGHHSDGLAFWSHMNDPQTNDPDWTVAWDHSYHGECPDAAIEACGEWLNEQAVPNDISFADAIRLLTDLQVGDFEQV